MSQLTFSKTLSEFIEQQAQSFVCYNEAWYNLIQSTYGYSLILLTTSDVSGQINGLLPLCYINSPLTGRHLVSLPFSDYCPLLASNEESANDLIDQAIQLAQRKKVKYLELRTGANDTLARRPDLKAHDLYVRWYLPLPDDPAALRSHVRKQMHQKVQRARRNEIHVRMAESLEDMQQYYRLHLARRSKKHGMPSQPQKYFDELWTALHPQGKIQVFLAEQNERVIAGIVVFTSGTVLQCAYSACDEQYLNQSPNHLLHWTAMEWGCAHHYKTYDFGRTAIDNTGLMEFKRRWGSSQEPLTYYYYPRIAGLAATSEKSRTFKLLTTIWQHLPLALASRLSNIIYKHMG